MMRDDLMDSFNGKSSKQPCGGITLYHALAADPYGDALIPVNEREVNGTRDKYLFASPVISKTLQHAFSWRDGEAIVGGPVEDDPGQFIIICKRSETLNRPYFLRIYSFSDDDFEKTVSGQAYIKPVKDTREYHTTQPVPFSKMTLAHEINDFETLLEMGLQVFSTEATCEDLMKQGFLEDDFQKKSSEEWLAGLLNSGDFTWENRDRGINPNPVLQRRMQKYLPAAARRAGKTP